MKFLVDQNLPAALASWIRARGFEARHVLEAGLSTDTDLCLQTCSTQDELEAELQSDAVGQ